MKGARVRAALLGTLLVFIQEATARSGPEHRSFRPLAMGNAFVAVVDDKDALYYNPAGLHRVQRMNARMNVLGMAAPLADGLRMMRFYNAHEKSFLDADSLRSDETLYSDMVPLSRKPIKIGVLHSSEFAMRDFGAAYWADAQVAPYPDDGLVFPQAGIHSIQIDAVFQIAGARGYLSDRLAVGAGYRFANRQEVRNFDVAVSELAEDGGSQVWRAVQDTLQAKLANLNDLGSYGHGVDLGVLWRQTRWISFGGAVQNLGMYLNGHPVTPELTVGLAVSPPVLNERGRYARRVNFALDVEDLLNRDRGYEPEGKVNLGAEVTQEVTWMLGIRLGAGLKGGYWSAGGGVSLFRALHIEAVSWAEEAGQYTGHIEERYYALNLVLGL